MNSKILTGLALSLIIASGTAFAGDGKKNKEGKGKGKEEAKFAKIDTNSDGVISKEEFAAFHKEKHKEKKAAKNKTN